MEGYDDPLGFSKQTVTILRGLGASSLIPNCKKKNISTEVLHELTKEDFMVLGANEEKAENIIETLSAWKRESTQIKTNHQDWVRSLLEILKTGEQHLSLIQAYVAYCRIRLTNERYNFYVDANKNLSASDAFLIAVSTALQEVEDAEKSLREFDSFISQICNNSKHSIYKYAIVGGLALLGFAIHGFRQRIF